LQKLNGQVSPEQLGTVVLVVEVVLVLLVLVLVLVLVVVLDVVVVPTSQVLFTQVAPGPQTPHWIGRPQPLSISPHCAPSAAQS